MDSIPSPASRLFTKVPPPNRIQLDLFARIDDWLVGWICLCADSDNVSRREGRPGRTERCATRLLWDGTTLDRHDPGCSPGAEDCRAPGPQGQLGHFFCG